MLRKLIRLVKKLITNNGNSLQELSTAQDRYTIQRQNGNLVIGNDCDISELMIHFHDTESNFPNIVIGNNCIIKGTILVYNNKSSVKIGDRVYIGDKTTLFCYDSIEILEDTMIAWGCTLMDTNAHSLISSERINDVSDWKRGYQFKNWSAVKSKPIKIGKQAWIGFNSIIIKGVSIGDRSVVGAGSVVTKNVEPNTIVGGNPAVFIKWTE